MIPNWRHRIDSIRSSDTPIKGKSKEIAAVYLEYMNGDRLTIRVPLDGYHYELKDQVGEWVKQDISELGTDPITQILDIIEAEVEAVTDNVSKYRITKHYVDHLQVLEGSFVEELNMVLTDTEGIDFRLGLVLKPKLSALGLAIAKGKLHPEIEIELASMPMWLSSKLDFVGIMDAFFEMLHRRQYIDDKPSDQVLAMLFRYKKTKSTDNPRITDRAIADFRAKLQTNGYGHILKPHTREFIKQHLTDPPAL